MPKSSQKSKRQILGVISAARAEQMLAEWVNTDLSDLEDANAWKHLFRRYPEAPSVSVESAACVAEFLRKAWDAPDLRKSEWYTWAAQIEYESAVVSARHSVSPLQVLSASESNFHVVQRSVETRLKMEAVLRESGEPPTVITPVEAAIFYLRHNRDRALHCPNPECPAPYFFRTKKGQKYCSPECAKPSQRESKRQWWAENRAKERNA